MAHIVAGLALLLAGPGCSGTGFRERPDAGRDAPIPVDAATGACPGAVFTELLPDTDEVDGDLALAIHRPSGALHVAFRRGAAGGRGARYSSHEGASWRTESIKEGAFGQYTSLALTAAGAPHVVLGDQQNGGLLHAWRESGGWRTERVTGATDRETALAIDGAGRLHLVAAEIVLGGDDRVLYLRRDGAGWKTLATIALAPDLRGRPALALAQGGKQIHVSYGLGTGQLYYRTGDTTGTFAPPVEIAAGITVPGSRMALDRGGTLHVLFARDDVHDLLHSTRTGPSSFAKEARLAEVSAVAGSVPGRFSAIVQGGQGPLWVVFAGDTNKLTVMHRAGAAWSTPQVLGACCGTQLAADVDGEGALHVAHWDTAQRKVRHTKICPPAN